MVTTIGIDPHKATHTAVAINGSEMVLGELTVPADQDQTEKLIEWAGELDGGGRVWARLPVGSAISCLNSSSLMVNTLSTCPQCSPLESGCWGRDVRIRTIPTMPGRWQ